VKTRFQHFALKFNLYRYTEQAGPIAAVAGAVTGTGAAVAAAVADAVSGAEGGAGLGTEAGGGAEEAADWVTLAAESRKKVALAVAADPSLSRFVSEY
jgi:hypothetical protein